jgi:secretion/DNA translocation related CpaE-like protein
MHGETGRPLLVTEDPGLLDRVLACAGRAGVEVSVAPGLPADGWDLAPLVLLGDDALRGAPPGPAARDGVVLIGTDLDDATVWSRALALGVEHVVFLPESQEWLTDLLADTRDDEVPADGVLGVIGGCGGAGATTMATALALAGTRSGRRTLLLDLDAAGGGIDLAVGTEGVPGERWSGALSSPGPAGHAVLPLGTLPALGDLTVLSWDLDMPPALPARMVRGTLDAALRRCDLVVADLPRAPDEAWHRAVARCRPLLLVVPARLRACASALRTVRLLDGICPEVQVLVRQVPAGLDPAFVAEVLGLPLAAVLPHDRELAKEEAAGQPVGSRTKGPVPAVAAELVQRFAQ